MNDSIFKRACKTVKQGGVIAYPTEGVYGIGCDPYQQIAIARILSMKKRSIDKGFIVIASEWAQIQSWLGEVPAERFAEVRSTWPGSTTWVFPATTLVPQWIKGAYDSVAVRITAHPIAKQLCDELNGPLVSTSFNIEDGALARNEEEAKASLIAKHIDLIVPGEIGDEPGPTPIRDALSDDLIRAT